MAAREFKLTETEANSAKEFEKEHLHKEIYKGAIGGHLMYSFVPTSIGDAVIVKCSICGEEKNITDYDSW
jgi:hypothetical protein